jgi:ABC-2 type transport system permease protein
MTATWLIARRELGGYLRTMSGYIIAASALFVQGILFNALALGSDQNRLSTEVLSQFFWVYSGTIIVVSVLLSMRLVAEERQTGTIVLLSSSPVHEHEVVLGKFFSSLIFLVLITLPSVFMPLLILVNGKLSIGHVATGYLGLFLLGSACLATGADAASGGHHLGRHDRRHDPSVPARQPDRAASQRGDACARPLAPALSALPVRPHQPA